MFSHIIEKIRPETEYALDLETTGFSPTKDSILGIALATEEDAWYIELPPKRDNESEHYKIFDIFKEEFKEIFDDPDKYIVEHNAKFDEAFLREYGIIPNNITVDTMVASHMVDELSPNGLKACALREFGYKMTAFEEVGGLFGSEMSTYAEDDARQTFRLWQHYKKILKEENMLQGFFDIEMPFVKVIMEMEREGVLIDTMLLLEYGKELKSSLNICEERIYEYSGTHFDIASPKQLAGVLYGKLNIDSSSLERGKNGCLPTDDKALRSRKGKYPIIPYLLEWRRASKLSGTYIKSLLNSVSPEDRRIRSKFWQTGTATGRLSSSQPINLQNIPNDKKYQIRKAFIAPQGKKLIVSDFSQIELRILAHASQEPVLLKVYREDGDVHQQTADLVGCTRLDAKTLNFGIIYGMGAPKLAETLGIEVRAAIKFLDAYFENLPQVKGYINAVQSLVYKQHWVKTLIGNRRRRFKEVDGRALRQAVNFVIQGSASELIKKAMNDMWAVLQDPKYKDVKILMTIHDEVVLEVPEKQAEEVARIVEDCMNNAHTFTIPTPCSMIICDSWSEGK